MAIKMTPEDVKALSEHLSYFGYAVTEPTEGEWYDVEHPSRLDFHMRFTEFGVRFWCPVNFGSSSLGDQLTEYLEFVNKVNEEAQLTSCVLARYTDSNNYYIGARALLSARYERSLWGVLLDYWRHDLDFLQSNLPELRDENRRASSRKRPRSEATGGRGRTRPAGRQRRGGGTKA